MHPKSAPLGLERPSGTTWPPTLPENFVYTSCYCEENIFLLAQTFLELQTRELSPWEVYVVFISNDNKTVSPILLRSRLGVVWYVALRMPLPSTVRDSEYFYEETARWTDEA